MLSQRCIRNPTASVAVISAAGGIASSLAPSGSSKGGLAPWQVTIAKDFMDAHLERNIQLSDVAEKCLLSSSHFSAHFASAWAYRRVAGSSRGGSTGPRNYYRRPAPIWLTSRLTAASQIRVISLAPSAPWLGRRLGGGGQGRSTSGMSGVSRDGRTSE
jgi:hypothetical protein